MAGSSYLRVSVMDQLLLERERAALSEIESVRLHHSAARRTTNRKSWGRELCGVNSFGASNLATKSKKAKNSRLALRS
jgi:hypothetical protein